MDTGGAYATGGFAQGFGQGWDLIERRKERESQDAARKAEEANRQAQLGISQQQLGFESKRLGIQEAAAVEDKRRYDAEEPARAANVQQSKDQSAQSQAATRLSNLQTKELTDTKTARDDSLKNFKLLQYSKDLITNPDTQDAAMALDHSINNMMTGKGAPNLDPKHVATSLNFLYGPEFSKAKDSKTTTKEAVQLSPESQVNFGRTGMFIPAGTTINKMEAIGAQMNAKTQTIIPTVKVYATLPDGKPVVYIAPKSHPDNPDEVHTLSFDEAHQKIQTMAQVAFVIRQNNMGGAAFEDHLNTQASTYLANGGKESELTAAGWTAPGALTPREKEFEKQVTKLRLGDENNAPMSQEEAVATVKATFAASKEMSLGNPKDKKTEKAKEPTFDEDVENRLKNYPGNR